MKYIFAFCIIFCIEACHSNIKTEEIELLSPSRIKGEKISIPERCYEDGILIDSILILKESCSENLFYAYNHCCPVKIVKYHLSSNSRNSFLDIQTLI